MCDLQISCQNTSSEFWQFVYSQHCLATYPSSWSCFGLCFVPPVAAALSYLLPGHRFSCFEGVCLELMSSWPPARVKGGCGEHSKAHFNLHAGFRGIRGNPGMNSGGSRDESGNSIFVGRHAADIRSIGPELESIWPGIGGPVGPELVQLARKIIFGLKLVVVRVRGL